MHLLLNTNPYKYAAIGTLHAYMLINRATRPAAIYTRIDGVSKGLHVNKVN